MESYGEFIKKHRILSGFKSQRRLAEKSGISAATISRIESEIQKPEVRTLQTLAHYLDSTSFVELMVVCGYWDEDQLLENSDEEPKGVELISAYLKKQAAWESKKLEEKETNETHNEQEFIEKINLTNEEIMKQFELEIDGESLSEEETKGIIAYVRALRQS
ncbi:helix-turn-helix domain-containing protein [Heyndrickxia oleronia]|uniref:helix-turn-helix domain-containing protein n=1 Tax=Heyndrickxia oleronia TaxID=38875 RepID=UPI0020420034|nr:helix-turn-helix transcriptional regulator [Heyndrickxia oleronia]MCM3456559.1 helix-turn-helix domain-containing protein [Heyndrickxia oleronia]